MKVEHIVMIDKDSGHSIEFGSVASWEPNAPKGAKQSKEVTVLHNRYDVDGKPDPIRSSEIDLSDLTLLVEVAADYDLFSDNLIEVMQNALTKALMRNQVTEVLDLMHNRESDDETPPDVVH